jgi:hypothetical protein
MPIASLQRRAISLQDVYRQRLNFSLRVPKQV